MDMVFGVMEAPSKLPLIKELQRGVDGLYRLPSTESIEHAEPPTLGLQLGKWMDTSEKVLDEWGEITMGVAKAK